MSDVIPPIPVDAPFGSYGWMDWYQKLRKAVNDAQTVVWTSITGKPTTLAGYGISDGATKNGSNRMNLGVDTTDDIITDSTTKGPVLKSPNGHYWRATISNAGVVTWTDLGTTKP